jgi:hypothetical protein
VFDNRVTIQIFGPKRNGVTGGRRKLHNEEIDNSYRKNGEEELVQIISGKAKRITRKTNKQTGG